MLGGMVTAVVLDGLNCEIYYIGLETLSGHFSIQALAATLRCSTSEVDIRPVEDGHLCQNGFILCCPVKKPTEDNSTVFLPTGERVPFPILLIRNAPDGSALDVRDGKQTLIKIFESFSVSEWAAQDDDDED